MDSDFAEFENVELIGVDTGKLSDEEREIIRWNLQAGNICIPGSSNEQHIIEDYDVQDFEVTGDEMKQMTDLERDDSFADY